MKRIFALFTSLALAATGLCKEPPKQLDKANVLPLSIDDSFQFRKTKIFINEPELFAPTLSDMLAFERQRVAFGAVTQYDRQQRNGHYYTFYWRANRKADLTLRFEYRQRNLGSYVQAKEISYPGVKGSIKSQFEVVGDEYREEGKVTAWRALLIEGGRIVGVTQSFLWN